MSTVNESEDDDAFEPGPTEASESEDKKGFASRAAKAAGSYSERIGENVRESAERVGRQQQDRIESYVNALRAAIESAASHLDDDGFATSARFARMAAEQIDGLADRIHESDVTSYIRSLEATVRSRPMITLGGAALLGFAAIQMMKGSDASRRRRQTRH